MQRLAVLVGLFALARAHDFKTCGSVDHLHVSSLVVTPDKPVPGAPVNVKLEFSPDEVLKAGSMLIDAKLFGVTVPGSEITLDICKLHKCPIPAKKATTLNIDYSVSKLVPSGITPTLLVNVTTAAKPPANQVGCLQFEVEIASPPEVNTSTAESASDDNASVIGSTPSGNSEISISPVSAIESVEAPVYGSALATDFVVNKTSASPDPPADTRTSIP